MHLQQPLSSKEKKDEEKAADKKTKKAKRENPPQICAPGTGQKLEGQICSVLDLSDRSGAGICGGGLYFFLPEHYHAGGKHGAYFADRREILY